MKSKIICKNIVIVLITQIVNLFIGFLSRRIFIECLGTIFLGYSSVFSNLISFLDLVELGIGSAITSFLYKPIVENNQKEIALLMRMYKKVYSYIGVAVAVLGIFISFLLPAVMKNPEHSFVYIRILYFVNLSATVSTYFFSYKRTLLAAEQKAYYLNIVDLFSMAGISMLQIVLMRRGFGYLIFSALSVFRVIISNLIINGICAGEHPYLHGFSGETAHIKQYAEGIKKFVKDVFIANIGAYILNCTDGIVISSAIGVAETGIFSNYTLVTGTVRRIVIQMLNAVQATYGSYSNSGNSKQQNQKMFEIYLFASYFIGNLCFVSIAFLLQPFLRIVFGETVLLPGIIPIALGINELINTVLQILSQSFAIYRLYQYDKKYVVLSAGVNIVLSFVLVMRIGIPGVLVGTTVAYLIYFVSRILIIYSKIFACSSMKIFIRCFWYAVSSLIQYFVISLLGRGTAFESLGAWMINAAWICLLTAMMTLAFFFRTDEEKFILRALRELL